MQDRAPGLRASAVLTASRPSVSSAARFRLALLGLVLLALLLGGCASTPASRFYLLDSLPPEQPARALSGTALQDSTGSSQAASATAAPAAADPVHPVLEIKSLLFPDYLERPQILLRGAPGLVQLAEFDRWSGSLKTDFERVLIENLSLRLPGLQLSQPGIRPADENVVQLAVEVVDFSGSPDGQARLSVRWQLVDAQRLQRETRYLCRSDRAVSVSYQQLWAHRLGLEATNTERFQAAPSPAPAGANAADAVDLSTPAYLDIVLAMSQCVAAFADDLAVTLSAMALDSPESERNPEPASFLSSSNPNHTGLP